MYRKVSWGWYKIWNGALRAAEAYRKMPMKYKLALSGAIFAGGLAGGALAMPLVAAGATGLAITQRMLGGASAAIAAEAGTQKLLGWLERKDVLKNTETSRIELEADISKENIDLFLEYENQELNQDMFNLSGQKGKEKAFRFGVAGAVFTAIALGAPGKVFGYVGTETGATGQVKTWTADLWQSFRNMTGLDIESVQPIVRPSPPTETAEFPSPEPPLATAPAPSQPPESAPAPAEVSPETAPIEGSKTIGQSMRRIRELTGQLDQLGADEQDPILGAQLRESAKEILGKHELLEQQLGKIDESLKAAGISTEPLVPKVPAVPDTIKQSPITPTPEMIKSSPEAARIAELATVKKGEGAWQPVRRQFYERMRLRPSEFGLTPEQAAKLPQNLEDLGKGTKATKILDGKTFETLQRGGYIKPDGTTRVGISRPGIKIVLDEQNRVFLTDVENPKSKPTYSFPEQKPASVRAEDIKGTGQTPEKVPEKAPARSYRNMPERSPLITTPEVETAPAPRGTMLTAHDAHTTVTPAEMEAVGRRIESANLKSADLTPTGYRPVADMTGKRFINELGRHSTEINEYRLHRAGAPQDIFINRNFFSVRGLRVDMPDAAKYLDLSERLDRAIKTYPRGEQSRLLKKPLGELLRTLSLTK